MKKFNIDSKVLKDLLSEVLPSISKKNSLPILENCLIEYTNSELSIYGTNLNVTKISKTKEIEASDDFKCLINFNDLYKIVNKLPHQPLTIGIFENQITISTFKGEYNIPTDSSLFNEFPEIKIFKEENSFELSGKTLNNIIKGIAVFCGNDDLRPIMTGINFNIKDGNLRASATNAHILRSVSISPSIQEINITIPNIKGLFKSVENDTMISISYDEKNVMFSYNDNVTLLRLVEGVYPNIWNVIPANENYKCKISFDRQEMIATLDRLKDIIDVSVVKIDINLDNIKITAKNVDYSKSAFEELDIKMTDNNLQENEEAFFGINPEFLLTVLNSLKDTEVELTLFSESRAILFYDEDDICLVMPQMIN